MQTANCFVLIYVHVYTYTFFSMFHVLKCETSRPSIKAALQADMDKNQIECSHGSVWWSSCVWHCGLPCIFSLTEPAFEQSVAPNHSGILALYTPLSLLFCCLEGHLIFMHFNTYHLSVPFSRVFPKALFVHPSRFGYSHCSFGAEVLSKNNGSLGRAFRLWWGRCKKRFDRRRWSWSIRRGPLEFINKNGWMQTKIR